MARRVKAPTVTATSAATDFFIGRERLFVRLDQLSGRAVWLQGPTGAGKTVLLRTYVRRSAEPVLWLAIDAKSTTPDALFNALAQAAQRAGVNDLPQFAGEHRQAPAELLRLCAERIAQRLPGAFVVVDDAQRLLPALASLLQVLIDACCTDLRLLFAGQDLPLGLEPQIAASKLVVVGHEQLQFDEAETNELAKRVGAAEALAHAMRERTSGWAAGLMLALQLGQGATTVNAQRRLEGPLASLVHGGVLAGVAPDTIRALAALAPARYIPASLLKAGAPWSHAVAELDRLSERGLFVEREENGDLRLHDLLRSALMQEALDDSERDAAVDALTQIDRCELALACIIAASGCGDRLRSWLGAHGEDLLFRSDIGVLTGAVLGCDSQLSGEVLLWCARGSVSNDLVQADSAAERAYSAFSQSYDRQAQRRCCGVGLLIQSVLLEGDRLSAWLTRLALLPKASEKDILDSPLLEAAGPVIQHVLEPSRTNSEEIYSIHTTLRSALRSAQPPHEAILAGAVAVYALLQLQRKEEIFPLIAEVEAAAWFIKAPPHSLIDWHSTKGYALDALGFLEDASVSLQEAATLARQQGMPALESAALGGRAHVLLLIGDLNGAESALKDASNISASLSIHVVAEHLWLTAWLELARRNPLRAKDSIDAAIGLLAGSGIAPTETLLLARAQVLYALGQHDEALALVESGAEKTAGDVRDMAHCTWSLLLSHRLWQQEHARALDALKVATGLIEHRRWTGFLSMLPEIAGLMAERALSHAGGGTVVRQAIRERRLPAPLNTGADWPWPLRVFVLGSGRIEHFDEILQFKGKVQRKPLDLLKFLAYARDLCADHTTICNALWPDAEPSAARRNLEMATARLREMLGHSTWVRVNEGRTRLDQQFVWSDAQALRQACSAMEEAIHRPGVRTLREASEALLRLYQGALLAGDEETPWLLGARERLRAAFVRSVRGAADALRREGQAPLATSLLEHAYAAEPLAEELAQLLIRTQLDLGQAAEAMRTYRHLSQMLSVLIGAKPSTDSQRLRQSILTQLEEQRTL
jgi:LuxR family transcriptional regulator, maltose regulon positive regulatory protein